jgi:hypothetical protein
VPMWMSGSKLRFVMGLVALRQVLL